ncbi:hypothetical protein P5V15_001547 [Pogonomyrmex californicus]
MLEYELELGVLTDAILLARQGLIHPKIFTPKKLFNNLNATRYALDDKRLPIALESNEFINLIDVSDINVFYKNHRLIYVIEMPLIEQKDFTLYHTIPLPIKQGERGIYAFINPIYTYLSIRSDKQLYTHLTEHDVSKCKKINNVMICKQTDLLYQISAIHNCESELLRSARLESILKECDIRVMRIHNTVWYQLKTTNSWLYTAPRNEIDILFIFCAKITNRDKPNYSLPDLLNYRRIAMPFQIMLCYRVEKRELLIPLKKTSYLMLNLIRKLCEDLKKHNVNISDLPLLNIGKTPNLDVHLLKTASTALDKIYREAEELGKHHRTETFYRKITSWFYYILYTERYLLDSEKINGDGLILTIPLSV